MKLEEFAKSLRLRGESSLARSFEKGVLSGSSSSHPTSLQFGPDGRLYVAQQDGLIKAYTVARRGLGRYVVTATERIAAVQEITNHNDDGALSPAIRGRQVTGMLVAGTRTSPLLFVTSSDPRIGGGSSGRDTGLDTNSGVVSRLTRTNSGWQRLDLIRGLPRSEENHSTNGLALSADHRWLYVAQGSNTSAGAPSNNFAELPQYALSAAILRLDLTAIGEVTYDLPTLDDDSRRGVVDHGDPFGGNDGKNQARLVEGGPVEVYAPGFRNPYDLALTDRGALYTVDNGMNRGWGGLPAGEGTATCTNEPSEGGNDSRDSLHLVAREGYYGGHPNPTRAHRGNGFNRDRQSPVSLDHPTECDWLAPGEENHALATFEGSTNGLVEYRARNLDGALQGDLLAVSLDNSLYWLELRDDGRRASRRLLFAEVGVAPLDVTAQSNAGPFPGTIWVADYGSDKIVVFEPSDYGLGRWEARAASRTARQEVSYVASDGLLYLAGGGRSHEAYNPATNRWHSVAALPENADHIQGVELDGLIYYIGGLKGWPGPEIDTVLVYDPVLDVFDEQAPMPRARGAGGVAAYRGKIFYAGGLHDGRAVPWLDAYDPHADRWERLPDMPRARDHFQAAVVGDKLYAIGGRDVGIDATTPAVDVYDLERGIWRDGLAPLPSPRGGFAVAVLGSEILVIGGEGGGKTFATVEAYDTQRDRWRQLAPLRVARHGISAAVCGGVYVAAGGRRQGGGDPTILHEVFFAGPSVPCG